MGTKKDGRNYVVGYRRISQFDSGEDTLEEIEKVAEHVVREGIPWLCPECPDCFDSPEDLGAHLVRHEPICPTKPKSPYFKLCRYGCGRWLEHRNNAFGSILEAHERICRGDVPICNLHFVGIPVRLVN